MFRYINKSSRSYQLFMGWLWLLSISCFIPQIRPLHEEWWVGQQHHPTVIWESRQQMVELPVWRVRLKARINRWRAKTRKDWAAQIVWHLLIVMTVVWIRLLQWVLARELCQVTELCQATGSWTGSLGGNIGQMRVQLQIQLHPELVETEAVEILQAIPIHTNKTYSVIEGDWEKVVLPSEEDDFQATLLPFVPHRPISPLIHSPELKGQHKEITVSPCLKRCCSTVAVSNQMGEQDTTGQDEKRIEGGIHNDNVQKRGGLSDIEHHFSDMKDPRMKRTQKHPLINVITMAICAVIGDANNWVEIETFCTAKSTWFSTFLDMSNGVPSHDTFGRVFRLLDDKQFQTCFAAWIQAVTRSTKGQIVPIDGKQLRRSHDKSSNKKAIHMVSAWAADNKLVLGQVKVDNKSNEITAIPLLLDMLALSGCIVTIDAMGCQKEIANKIIDKGADYVLALKGNQSNLHKDVRRLFDFALDIGFVDYDYHKTVDKKSHGRHEIRHCWTISDPASLGNVRNVSAWQKLQTIVMVKSERTSGKKTTTESRYFISSLAGDAQQTLAAVREHWHIENQLHWILDVAFAEDSCRVRKENGPQNFAVLRHIAMNLLTQEDTAKCGIQAKRKKAGWDNNYMLKVLSGFT